MSQVTNNGVKYHLEAREHDLYGFGVDVFMLDTDGDQPREPIAFIPGKDENAATVLTRQWLKIAFPAELPKGKRK